AASPSDIWAVGARAIEYLDTVVFDSLVEHWDGTQWTAMYNIPGVFLYGVKAVASNDVWAVGTFSIGTLIIHWDGSSWSTVPSPNPGHGGDLNDVDSVSSNDL